MYGALERGEFYLLYQPQIELATGNMMVLRPYYVGKTIS